MVPMWGKIWQETKYTGAKTALETSFYTFFVLEARKYSTAI